MAKPHQSVSSSAPGRTAHGARGEGGEREERRGRVEDGGRRKRKHHLTKLEVARVLSPSVRV